MYLDIKTIFEKKYVENETLFYKVKKYAGVQSTTPIKTYLVPSSGDVTSLIDTQVSYGKVYSYHVSAFVVIYGVNYKYDLKTGKKIIHSHLRRDGSDTIKEGQCLLPFSEKEGKEKKIDKMFKSKLVKLYSRL